MTPKETGMWNGLLEGFVGELWVRVRVKVEVEGSYEEEWERVGVPFCKYQFCVR